MVVGEGRDEMNSTLQMAKTRGEKLWPVFKILDLWPAFFCC